MSHLSGFCKKAGLEGSNDINNQPARRQLLATRNADSFMFAADKDGLKGGPATCQKTREQCSSAAWHFAGSNNGNNCSRNWFASGVHISMQRQQNRPSAANFLYNTKKGGLKYFFKVFFFF